MSNFWQALLFASILVITPTNYVLGIDQNSASYEQIRIDGYEGSYLYLITGDNYISKIIPDKTSNKLIISLHAVSNGKLQFILPKDLINVTDTGVPYYYFGSHTIYYAQVKQNVSYQPKYIIIPFEKGNWTIAIIGTHVLPEFGFTSTMILPISVIGMILIYSCFRSRC